MFENAAKRLISFLKSKQGFNCGNLFNVILNYADVTFKVANTAKTSLPKIL